MFGYGRAQNVAALVAATIFISFTSFELYREAIPRLFEPQEASYQNLSLAVGVLIISMFIAAIPLINLFKQKKRGAAAKAQLTELFNDELGLIAALLGTLFIVQGNMSFLLGRSPGREFLNMVESTARSVDGVPGVHDMRAEYIGPDTVHTGMHIDDTR